MKADEVRPGQVVVSLAGRDRGRPFIVLKVLNERLVLVADGDLRKVNKPKKKNVRHLQARDGLSEKVAKKVVAAMTVTDQDLREALQGCIGGSDRTEGLTGCGTGGIADG